MNHLLKRAALALALVAGVAVVPTAHAAETLVSDTRSSSVTPPATKPVKIIVRGTGSAPLTVVYSYDRGVSFQPKAVATDGSDPVIMDQITYNGATQNGLIIEVVDSAIGYAVAVLPGTVIGTVTIEFAN